MQVRNGGATANQVVSGTVVTELEALSEQQIYVLYYLLRRLGT